MPARLMLIGLLMTAAMPAVAQQAAQPVAGAPGPDTPSVEGYLCAFAGKCDGAEAPVATRDAPETRGFRFARPVAETRDAATRLPAAATTMPRARGAVRPRVGRSAAYAAAPTAARYDGAVASVGAVPAGRPRADLMIGFELNSAQLTQQGMGAAQVFARSLMMPELQGKRFMIEGHTDLRGGRAVNAALSARRAQAVADYLATLGVDRSRLQTRGFGASKPLPGHAVTDPTNRRVEAELLS